MTAKEAAERDYKLLKKFIGGADELGKNVFYCGEMLCKKCKDNINAEKENAS